MAGDCIEWPGRRSATGYGWLRIQVVPELTYIAKAYAHRVSYAMKNKIHPFSPEMPEVVMHTCDNPPCYNPDHLVGGTHKENAIDKERKGRGRWGRRKRWPSNKEQREK